MSFSSLPPELVHQVIESTVPHTFHSKTYNKRQQTLCSLSLVLKLFRSIAQPLLIEIIKLGGPEEPETLQATRALGGGTRYYERPRILLIDLDEWDDLGRTQEEEDRFLQSLRVFETMRSLTVAYIEDERHFTYLINMVSSHITNLQLSVVCLEAPKIPRLPSLYSLALYNVSFKLFSSLLDPPTVPNLRNFALFGYWEDSVEWLKDPPISRLLLQLETFHLDARLWLELDAGFRRLAASRTLIDVESLPFERACHPETSIIHARLSGVFFHPVFSNEHVAKRSDLYASFISNSPSVVLKSLYLDSSLQCSPLLPPHVRSSVDNLARTCQERKVEIIFDQAPISSDIDPFISAEFVRRQKYSREVEARGEDTARRE